MDRRTLLKTSLGSMAPIAPAAGQNGPSTMTAQAQGTLVAINPADVAAVVARPETILTVYQALAPGASADSYMRQALGAEFGTLVSAGCFATYAAIFAGIVAPSGATPLDPMTASLQQLLKSAALACGHYDKLTMLLTLLGYPEVTPPDAGASDPPKPTMHFAEWIDSAPIGVGVHSQLVMSNVLDSAYLLLDPMYSFAMRLPYASGYPKASLSVLQNAAALLQTPSTTGNYVDLWPGNSAVNRSQVVTAMTSGVMGPQYIDSNAQSAAPGWDQHMARVIANMA
jgi:hypothetical protein